MSKSCDLCHKSPGKYPVWFQAGIPSMVCDTCVHIFDEKGKLMGRTDENPTQETKFQPCTLCKAVTSEYEITVTQISTSKILAVLACCAECASKSTQ